MQCPFCQYPNNRVLESRSAESDRSIRRRRECMECERRFTTYERIEYVPIVVVKRDGLRESFDRSKLLRGVVTACEKTGVSAHAMEVLVDEIEAELQQQAVREIASEGIGEKVLARLRQLSEVAYVRFASVYRQFQGIRDFTETLSDMKGHPKDQAESSDCAPSGLTATGLGGNMSAAGISRESLLQREGNPSESTGDRLPSTVKA